MQLKVFIRIGAHREDTLHELVAACGHSIGPISSCASQSLSRLLGSFNAYRSYREYPRWRSIVSIHTDSVDTLLCFVIDSHKCFDDF